MLDRVIAFSLKNRGLVHHRSTPPSTSVVTTVNLNSPVSFWPRASWTTTSTIDHTAEAAMPALSPQAHSAT